MFGSLGSIRCDVFVLGSCTHAWLMVLFLRLPRQKGGMSHWDCREEPKGSFLFLGFSCFGVFMSVQEEDLWSLPTWLINVTFLILRNEMQRELSHVLLIIRLLWCPVYTFVSLLFLLYLHIKVTTYWRNLYLACIVSPMHSNYSHVKRLCEHVRIPPVEEKLASYLSPGAVSS